MNLWANTIGYGASANTLDYLTKDQNCRAERIRIARMLWKGQHRKAFLEERRTQFDFTKMRVQGYVGQPYVTYNVLRLITTTITDLLIGAEPIFRVEGQARQALDDLSGRSDLHRVFYDASAQASWSSEATVEICRHDGEVYVQNVNPGELFPLGAINPDGQHSAYRRFATESVGTQTLLLETTYRAGVIERECFKLDGTRKSTSVDLSQWPMKREDGSDLQPREATGIDWNTIVWMANELDEGAPTSDYDGLLDLQDTLNHKQTQIAVVIAKHANPKMIIPGHMADAEGSIRANHEVYFTRSKDESPSYLTWSAELESAIADRDFTLQAICIAAELSQVLLGIKQGATPEAARKLRLEANKSLARAQRKASFVRPFVRTALDTALMMINSGNRVALSMNGASAEFRDGLPVDELEEANTLSILTGGKPVMSLERAVEKQLPDPEAQAVELGRLKKAAEAATPSMFLGGGREAGETEQTGVDPQGE